MRRATGPPRSSARRERRAPGSRGGRTGVGGTHGCTRCTIWADSGQMRLALLANDAAGSGATSADRGAGARRARGAQVELHDVRAVCGPDGDPAAVLFARPDRVVVAGG